MIVEIRKNAGAYEKMNLEPPWTNVAFLLDENIRNKIHATVKFHLFDSL